MKASELPLFSRRLGAAVREQRTTLGLTQSELAARVGCKLVTMGRIERGEQNLTLKSLERLISAVSAAVREIPPPPSSLTPDRSACIEVLQMFASAFGNIHHQRTAHPKVTKNTSKACSDKGGSMVHEKGHDWGREPINRSERRILEACQVSPRSTPELLKSLGYTTRTGNFRQALSRLIDAQLLELRYPDHPRSKRQQYRLTAKGRAVGAP